MVNLLGGINSTSSALKAERVRMDVVAQNIANAHVTHGPDGKPYQRQQVVFENFMRDAEGGSLGAAAQGGPVAKIERDQTPSKSVFMPSHPDADSNGNVQLPDINIANEMSDLILASRSFEANLAVVKTAKSMAQQTLGIGKR